MKNTVRIRLNKDMLGFKSGRELVIDVDENGTALDKNWRRRLADAEHDGHISIVEGDEDSDADEVKDEAPEARKNQGNKK